MCRSSVPLSVCNVGRLWSHSATKSGYVQWGMEECKVLNMYFGGINLCIQWHACRTISASAELRVVWSYCRYHMIQVHLVYNGIRMVAVQQSANCTIWNGLPVGVTFANLSSAAWNLLFSIPFPTLHLTCFFLTLSGSETELHCLDHSEICRLFDWLVDWLIGWLIELNWTELLLCC